MKPARLMLYLLTEMASSHCILSGRSTNIPAIGQWAREPVMALGAMHAVYERYKSAKDIAMAGAQAGAEFDTSSHSPIDVETIRLNREK